MTKLPLFLCSLASFSTATLAQTTTSAQKNTDFSKHNVVDEIIWVVGDEPILLSDVEEMRISSELMGTPVENPSCTIPEQIAINKLFLHQAELDSVEVSEGISSLGGRTYQ